MASNISIHNFSYNELQKLVFNNNVQSCMQIHYFFNYLERLSAKSIIVENSYIDRHYIQEYQKYYSLCFDSKSNKCKRLHFFSEDISEDNFDQCLIDKNYSDKILKNNYLGFMNIRPINSVPIGRTVLVTINKIDSQERIFTTTTYPVHLAGIELWVDGLAFQQQDMAVGACATTAIWASLQKVCKDNGKRAVTPLDITTNGTKYFITAGREFPASDGLTLEQCLEAIRGSGFAPHLLKADSNLRLFRESIKININSGIPAVLLMQRVSDGVGHAVCIVGYKETDQYIPFFSENDIKIFSSDINKIYIHDDRLGSYARATLYEIDDQKRLKLMLKLSLPGGIEEEWIVKHVIFPLYEKIRTDEVDQVVRLTHFVKFFGYLLKKINLKNINYYSDTCIIKSGDILSKIISAEQLPKSEKIQFLKTIHLPRYVGFSNIYFKETDKLIPLFSLLYDTTDFVRDRSDCFSGLLGIVCHQDFVRELMSRLHLQNIVIL